MSTFFNDAINEAKALIAEHEKYEKRPTKASSRRIRAHLTAIRKAAPGAKRELILADRAA